MKMALARNRPRASANLTNFATAHPQKPPILRPPGPQLHKPQRDRKVKAITIADKDGAKAEFRASSGQIEDESWQARSRSGFPLRASSLK
jgi:hypothetical protein